MVNFDFLFDASNCNTDVEKVALALYYLHRYEDCETAVYDDLADVIRSSDVVLSSQKGKVSGKKAKQAVIDPIENLRRRNLVNKKLPVGYYLNEDGLKFVKRKITGPVPDEDTPTGKFIDFQTDDDFVSNAIREINLCYQAGAYTASLVMLRRLIEELLIHIHRAHFGADKVEKYYEPESGRHKGLKELIAVFQTHLSEFARYSTAIDQGEDFVQELQDFRKQASSQAHSIDIHLDKDELRGRSIDATRVVKILYKIREEIQKTTE